MERLLLTAFKERRNEGRAVCALWVKTKGREIMQQVYEETDFKASRGVDVQFYQTEQSIISKENKQQEGIC